MNIIFQQKHLKETSNTTVFSFLYFEGYNERLELFTIYHVLFSSFFENGKPNLQNKMFLFIWMHLRKDFPSTSGIITTTATEFVFVCYSSIFCSVRSIIAFWVDYFTIICTEQFVHHAPHHTFMSWNCQGNNISKQRMLNKKEYFGE